MEKIFIIAKLIFKKKLKVASNDEKQELKLSKLEIPVAKNVNWNHITEQLELYSSINTDQGWKTVLHKYQKKKYRFKPKMISYWKYAALVLCFVGLSYSYYNYFSNKKNDLIIPKDAIVLRLENGSVKIIDSNGEEKIVNSNGEVVGNQKSNQLVYNSNSKNGELVYNELSIPYGKQFQVKLSDGTKVHLNAGASLKYPVHFVKGQNRNVYLTGEAYFDVTKDKNHPFVVHSDHINIKVLGTQFNVTSYPDENKIDAVLVEGSVQLSSKNNIQKQFVLVPGEKASWDKTSAKMDLSKVDTSLYIAWTKGQLVFRKARFQEIIQKLNKTYNVNISCNNQELNDEKFSANFSIKEDKIENVLHYFSKIYPFIMKTKGNRIEIK